MVKYRSTLLWTFLLIAGVVLINFSLSNSVFAQVFEYKAYLTGIDTGADTQAFGVAEYLLNNDLKQMDYKITLFNINDVNAATLNMAPKGQDGPIIVNLYPFKTLPSVSPDEFHRVLIKNTIDWDPLDPSIPYTWEDFIDLVTSHKTYTNIQTKDDTLGFIRGQIVPVATPTKFNVTIENISNAYQYPASGIFSGTVPGPIKPGGKFEFSFNAPPGSKLSFATTYLQSNGLFYAPNEKGISLYDANGNPNSGDITSQIFLWDAGTKNHVPVQLVKNVGKYPTLDSMRIKLFNISASRFGLSIEDISNDPTYIMAPGVWLVHNDDAPLFKSSANDYGDGLKELAENGDPSKLSASLASKTGIPLFLSPGLWVVTHYDNPLFTVGTLDRGEGLKQLAEDGNPFVLAEPFSLYNALMKSDVISSGFLNGQKPGPIGPGEKSEFSFEAVPGQRLSFVTMDKQSNDAFYAIVNDPLFTLIGKTFPVKGNITSLLFLYDAGTEVNQEPGFGSDQSLRQKSPNTGTKEQVPIKFIIDVNDGFAYPDISKSIRVSITPLAKQAFTITAFAGPNGSITPSGTITVNSGAEQKFIITADTNSHVTDVVVDGVSVGAVTSYVFNNVTDDHVITASFGKQAFTITASAGSNGSITPSGTVSVDSGSNQTFTIKADANYHVADLLVDGKSVGALSSYTFNNITANHTIIATFEQNIHPTNTIVSTAGENGSISPSGSVTVDSGISQKFTIAPSNGYHVADVLVDGKSAGAVNEYNFDKVGANHTISVTFAINTYTIKSNAGEHGKISPTGDFKVNHGTDQFFTILPDNGFGIQDVVVDGKSVGPLIKYGFLSVDSDHTINVTFMSASVPDISVSPMDSKFGDVKIGNSSSPLSIVISNKGSAELNVLDVTLSDTVNYVLDTTSGTDVCGGTKSKIAAGGKCGFTIVFKPLSLDAKPVTIKIVSDDPDTPNLDIQLTGNGTGIKGDVNDDGQVRSNDTILSLRFAVGLAEPNAYQKWSADMNNDGNIRSNDAILIQRKAVGLGAPERDILAKSTQYISITLNEVHGLAGETVTIPLRIDDTNVLAGGDVYITYDSKVLQTIDILACNDILMASNTSEIGTIRISFAASSKLENETIANIRFKVISDSISPLNFRIADLYGTDSLPLISKAINTKFASWAIKPSDTVLLQNFPNPFNPETWIPYQLKENADVTIRIQNIKGELVRELKLGYKPSGSYMDQNRAVYWDGKNESGEKVASGIYFYSIKAGDFSAIKKMLVKK